MAALFLQCVLGSSLGYALLKFPKDLLNTCVRMILFKVPLVIPTRTSWLVLLFPIGTFGFVSQVPSSTGPSIAT